MERKNIRSAKKSAKVQTTAAITGVSANLVYKVLRGERNNEEVLNVYMELDQLEGISVEMARQNHLLAAVNQLVPFTSPNRAA